MSADIAAWFQVIIMIVAAGGVVYIIIYQARQNHFIEAIQQDNKNIQIENAKSREQLTTIVKQTNSNMEELQRKLEKTEDALQHALVGQAKAQADTEQAAARSERLGQTEPPA